MHRHGRVGFDRGKNFMLAQVGKQRTLSAESRRDSEHVEPKVTPLKLAFA